MANKFRIGDIVVINPDCKKLPKWIKDSVRPSQKRRIKGVWYYQTQQHTLYTIGNNWRGTDISFYHFRANMLEHYKMKVSTRKLKKVVTGGLLIPHQDNYNNNLMAVGLINELDYVQNTKPFNIDSGKSLSNLNQF